MSMGSMPCSAIVFMCSGSLRLARMPAWMRGCIVLTRPPSISGNCVTSETSVTGMPLSLSMRAVPPVEMISTPMSAKRARELFETGFVEDGDESSFDLHLAGSLVAGRCRTVYKEGQRK